MGGVLECLRESFSKDSAMCECLGLSKIGGLCLGRDSGAQWQQVTESIHLHVGCEFKDRGDTAAQEDHRGRWADFWL